MQKVFESKKTKGFHFSGHGVTEQIIKDELAGIQKSEIKIKAENKKKGYTNTLTYNYTKEFITKEGSQGGALVLEKPDCTAEYLSTFKIIELMK